MRALQSVPDKVVYESIFAYPSLTLPQQLAEICETLPAVALYTGPDPAAGRAFAELLAQAGSSVLLLEGPGGPSAATPAGPGWGNRLEEGKASPQDASLWESCRTLIRQQGEADVLPWGSSRARPEMLLAGAAVQALLRACRARYDHVVMALPLPAKRSAAVPVCPYIERALLQADPLNRAQLETLLEQLCEYDILVLGVVEPSVWQAVNKCPVTV